MDGYAVRGEVWVNPETAGTGGTRVLGLDPGRPIRVIPAQPVRVERFGGADDAVRSYRRPGAGVWVLELPIAGDNQQIRDLALGVFVNANGLASVGDGSFADPVSVVVRPLDTTEEYIFMPAVRNGHESEVLLNRSRVETTQTDGSVVLLVCGRPEGLNIPAVSVGSVSVIDELVDQAEEVAVQYLRKTVTVAELVALGEAQAGQISMGAALPVGAVPVMLHPRNRGTAFTSADGAISAMTATIVATGQTSGAFDTVTGLMTASQRGQRAATVAAASSSVLPSPNTSWTPFVRFTANQDFDSFEGGDDGIEIILIYQPVVLL